MFGSLRQSVCASFADRFIESGELVYFRPMGRRAAYGLSANEADAAIDEFSETAERVDAIRSRLTKAVIPAVIIWAILCVALRKMLGSDPSINALYLVVAMGLMIGLPLYAYGQFWLALFFHERKLAARLSDRPSIAAPMLGSYRTRNPFQFALRWTALLGLCAFIAIGGILPETHPDLAQDLRPWIEFDVQHLLTALGLLYGLSMLWDWIAARRALNARN